jgi:hypothetical protein
LKRRKHRARPPRGKVILETSPDNFQAWLALPGAEDKEFARRVRKGTGADATAKRRYARRRLPQF